MSDLSITVAAYDDLARAQIDWDLLEVAGDADSICIADAAMLVRDRGGRAQSIHRELHHTWGEDAVVEAAWRVLFPPSVLGGAVAAGLGGGMPHLDGNLVRGDLEGLGDTAGASEVAIVVVTDPASVTALPGLLFNAIRLDTEAGGDADRVRTLDAPGAPRAGRTRT
ncbi:MAG TPA: hypothetical protein VE575_01885 [Acidimicrobiales bacterium]|nr:hypothetical protein [Acidimicrobiales bacterium]